MISFNDILALKNADSLKRLIDNNCDGCPERFTSDFNTLLNRQLQTDIEGARKLMRHIRRFIRHLPEKLHPRYRAMNARLSHWGGESRVALREYTVAIKQLLGQRQFNAAARARQGLMDVHMYLGNYREAIAAGKQALAYFRRVGDNIRAARVMTNIGNVYHRWDRNILALRYYDRARAFFARTGGVPLAIVDYNRANVYANMNCLPIAERLYRQSADVYRQNGLDLIAEKAEYSLAYLYYLDDRYTDAINTFERVHDAFVSLGDSRAAAVTRLDMAEINIRLNQYGSAVMLGGQAASVFKQNGMSYEQAKATYFMAEAHLRLHDYREASRLLDDAEVLFSGEGNMVWLGMIGLARSRLHLAANQIAEALQQAKKARRLFAAGGDDRRRTDAEITLIEAGMKTAGNTGAVRRALRLLDGRLVSYQRHHLLGLVGEHYYRRNEYAKALAYYKKALQIVEKMLFGLYTDEIRFFFALDKYATYLKAVDCLLRLGRVRDSFLLHSRALAVLNQRRIKPAELTGEIPKEFLAVRSRLRAELKKLNRAVPSHHRQAPGILAMQQAENRLWAQERKVRTRFQHSGASSDFGPDRDLISSVGNDEILVSFTSTADSVGAYLVNSGQVRHISCPVTLQGLENTVRELHFLMEKSVYAASDPQNNGSAATSYMRDLYRQLIAPLDLPEIGTRLILMVDGIFAQIPYPALQNDVGTCLIDRFDINLIANPDDLRAERRDIDRKLRNGSAIFAPAAEGLPMIEAEGRRIKRLFPRARLYTDSKANCTNLKKELAKAEGFVHIATHASRSSENPLFSRLLLDDGPFFPFDLYSVSIKTRLVSLSGCQTAAPGIYYGNAFSLAKAFYQGGIRFVLASLWPVSDKTSMAFMTVFYKTLRTSGDATSAYRTAARAIKDINDDPALWSPFILLGL